MEAARPPSCFSFPITKREARDARPYKPPCGGERVAMKGQEGSGPAVRWESSTSSISRSRSVQPQHHLAAPHSPGRRLRAGRLGMAFLPLPPRCALAPRKTLREDLFILFFRCFITYFVFSYLILFRCYPLFPFPTGFPPTLCSLLSASIRFLHFPRCFLAIHLCFPLHFS